MNALDELMAEFNGNAGTMPAVNPPEAAKVLETQTTPEVAGEPEPPAVETTTAPPTEKPAEVKAAEAAKARKPRAPRTPAAEPATSDAKAVAKALTDDDLATLILAVSEKLPKGARITIASALGDA